MEYLNQGKYYGVPGKVINCGDLIITDNEYIHERVDWHYHENVYFTYMLAGRLSETSKTETYSCTPGTLLYHNRQEPHYNIKPPGYTRGFQVECTGDWFKRHNLSPESIEGSGILANPDIKVLFNRIYIESIINDNASLLSIESLLLGIFGSMLKFRSVEGIFQTVWLNKIKDILNDRYAESITLEMLSLDTGIHPVHISRMFPKYSGSTIGAYIRLVRVNKAIELITNTNLSLTAISNNCGFSDQSHFIRTFKTLQGITPLQFKKAIKKS